MISRFEFSERDFQFISSLVARHAGITLSTGKRELVYGRLAKRLRLLGIETFSEYCDILRDEQGDELHHCVNAITTNVTAFFREDHHFQFLHTTLLPELVEQSRRTAKRDLRVWSAGCSTGQEPYSIAMSLCEYPADLSAWDIQILATDLDSKVLEQARSGIYRVDHLENVSPARKKRFFMRGKGRNEGFARIVPEVQQMIRFERLNLIEPWEFEHDFDIIFCRNVMIYFDNETRKRLLMGFAANLAPGGYLFVGHSESLSGIKNIFDPAGTTIHRKLA
jgi:chemotaxis protein methyltransferase CheR